MILTIGALVKDDQGRQYILDELLGSGGFGSVFKAHRDDGTIYAVKTLLPSFDDDKAYLSFKNEIAQEYVKDLNRELISAKEIICKEIGKSKYIVIKY